MEDNKVSGKDLRTGEEIWISYIDDNGLSTSGFGVLIELSETLVKFKTNQNIICIPISKLIKLKQRLN